MNDNDTNNDKNNSDKEFQSSNAISETSSNESTKNSYNDQDIPEPFWNKRININWTNFFHFLIVVVTAVYVFFAYQQWQTLEKQSKIIQTQNENIREQFITENRAWLNVRPLSGPEHFDNNKLKVEVEIKNTGKSPAQNILFHSRLFFNRGLIPEEIISGITSQNMKANRENPPYILAPNSSRRFYVESETYELIPPSVIDEIYKQSLRFYILGRVVYDVITEKSKETTFCYEYVPKSKTYKTCLQGNTMK